MKMSGGGPRREGAMFDGLRHSEDPGIPPLRPDRPTSREEKIAVFRRLNDPAGNLYWIARAPLRPERLAAGGTITAPDVQVGPSIRMPGIAEWFAVAVLVLVGIGLLWVL
jgi:hypothetical protein